jgi:hypothetical protein
MTQPSETECGQQVFPDHPEWGDIPCNRPAGHEPPCARFESLGQTGAKRLVRPAPRP